MSPDPPSAPVFSLVSDPAANDGCVKVVAGQTLRVTAQVDGAPYPGVTWTVNPVSTTPPAIDGATVTVAADVPGQTLLVSAVSVADPTVVSEVLVDVVPPDCRTTWPLLRPTHPGTEFPDFLHIPVAVRRDGTPMVAIVMTDSQAFSAATVSVVAWDGLDWSDVAEPIAVSNWPYLQFSDSPLALALDDEDRPILAYQGTDGIEVQRAVNGVWQSLGAPSSAYVAGDMVLALDGAGNPIIATTTGTGFDPSPVWVWRWDDAKWVSRQAFAGMANTIVDIRSLVLDGDVPIVSFEVHDTSDIRSHVVRMDDQVIDLGSFDDDATVYAFPRPLLAVPGADQPLVAWIDPISGGPDGGLVVRFSQRAAGGWEPFAAPLTLPSAGERHPHALLWDDTAARALVAAPAVGPTDTVATAEVRAVQDGSRVRAPVLDLDPDPYGSPVMGLGMARDPTGGYVVAIAGKQGNLTPRISVARVRP